MDTKIKFAVYKQNDVYIVYSPDLGLSGYEKSLTGAYNSFKIVLDEYFKFGISNGTLIKDLYMQGWTYNNGKLQPPNKKKQ